MFSVDTAQMLSYGIGFWKQGGRGTGQVLFINIKIITSMFVANGNTF